MFRITMKLTHFIEIVVGLFRVISMNGVFRVIYCKWHEHEHVAVEFKKRLNVNH